MADEAVVRSEALLLGVNDDPDADGDAAEVRFTALYEELLPRVYAFFRSQLNCSAAQELTSRVYFKVYQHRDVVPPGAQGALWLFRIAHNTLIDYRRVERRREAAAVALDETALASEAPDPETAYAIKERHTLLLRAVAQLDEADRLVLGLKFAGHRTNGEIATILRTSNGAVSMRLLRALRRLRRRLSLLRLI